MKQEFGVIESSNSVSILRGFPSKKSADIKLISPPSTATTIIWCRERNGFEIDYQEKFAPLSVRCVFKGQETFRIGHRPKIVLDQSSYLVLNDGQGYDHLVEGKPEIESLTILFGVDFASEILSTQFGDNDVLQFDCSSKNGLPIQFCERLRQNDNIVTPRLARIRSLVAESGNDEYLIVEELKVILQRLLHVHRADVFAAEALPYRRSSTKLQMFDRLQRARDYISSALDDDWRLPVMAETVGFSPYHFQRCFTQMFGETPHQYLTNCRLRRASLMLKDSEKTVTQICGEVGFESLGSFSTLFCQRYGVSPIRYRHVSSDFSADLSL